MLRPYFCAYHSYLENMELLNSEERGRLFTALLEYSKDGTLIPLTGNERFVFPGIRSQIDRDKEQWKKTDEQQASYGRKGGRPRKKPPDGENEKATLLNDTDKKGGFSEKGSLFSKSLEKKKDKEKDKDNISSSTATAENDISACVQAYEQNIGPIARAAFDDISRQLADLPADLICEAIGEAALNNKRSWNYVKAILKRCREQNILSVDAYRGRSGGQSRARCPPTEQAGGSTRTAQKASGRDGRCAE